MLPTHRDWKTESRSKIGCGEHDKSVHFFENVMKNKADEKRRHDFATFNKARDRLEDLAVVRFGSVRNMFRSFDDDKSGMLTLDEFSKAMKKRNLETMFPREDQRLIFDHLDQDGSGMVDYREFLKLFSLDDHSLDTFDRDIHGSDSRPQTAPASATVTVNSEVQKIKDKIVEKIFSKRRNTKVQDGKDYATVHLLKAFQHIDTDMSGSLSRDEIVQAFGPNMMNLGIADGEIEMLMNAMDVNKDNSVSYPEFVKFLEVHDIEPSYNPFLDSRQRSLTNLRAIASSPWRFEKETRQTVKAFETLNLMRGQDIARNAVVQGGATTRPSSGRAPDAAVESPEHEPSIHEHAPASTRSRPATSWSSREVHSAPELFATMHATQTRMLDSICPRFVPQDPTDWSRVGVGGNGTRQDSGIFLPSRDRFRTTCSDYYPPLRYDPSKSGVVRDTSSDAEKEALARQRRREAKRNRTKKTLDMIDQRISLSETMMQMNAEQKLKRKAKEMEKYFTLTVQREHEEDMRRQRMSRKPFPLLSDKMWNGSKESTLHSDNRRSKSNQVSEQWKTEFKNIGRSHARETPKPFVGLGQILIAQQTAEHSKERAAEM